MICLLREVVGGFGSSFYIDERHVVTNAHVTSSAAGSVTIVLADEEKDEGLSAQLIPTGILHLLLVKRVWVSFRARRF